MVLSASDSVVFLRHCTLYKFTYLLTYLPCADTMIWCDGAVWKWCDYPVEQTQEHESGSCSGRYGPSYRAQMKATTISGKNKEKVIHLVWAPECAGLEGNRTSWLKREVYEISQR